MLLRLLYQRKRFECVEEESYCDRQINRQTDREAYKATDRRTYGQKQIIGHFYFYSMPLNIKTS